MAKLTFFMYFPSLKGNLLSLLCIYKLCIKVLVDGITI